jgi:FKBP-type peptidyl-prolyl cis-trans isomerase
MKIKTGIILGLCAVSMAAAPVFASGKQEASSKTTAKTTSSTAAPAEAAKAGSTDAAPAAGQDDTSYVVGMVLGQNLKQMIDKSGMTFNYDELLNGIKDEAGGKPRFSPEQANKILQTLQENMAAAQEKKAAKDKEADDKFLAENMKKSGVKTTASGLQYQVIKKAKGPLPKATDTVKVDYVGTYTDGKVFDQNKNTTFKLDQVIKGFTEGLTLMPVGSEYKLFMPAGLAYGERAMIFDVTLNSIEPPEKAEKKAE